MVWAHTNPNILCLTSFISISTGFHFPLHSNINTLLIVVCFFVESTTENNQKEESAEYEYRIISIFRNSV